MEIFGPSNDYDLLLVRRVQEHERPACPDNRGYRIVPGPRCHRLDRDHQQRPQRTERVYVF